MKKITTFKALSEKVMVEIKNMNLSKEILLSLNFKDLIENLCETLDEEQITNGNNIYLFIDYIIKNYTNLDKRKSFFLWHGHKSGNYEELYEAISYIDSFNFQLAKYFNETIF